MMKTNNPKCPYTKEDCIITDFDGYLNCKNCSKYGNGVRATGELPFLENLYNFIKKKIKH